MTESVPGNVKQFGLSGSILNQSKFRRKMQGLYTTRMRKKLSVVLALAASALFAGGSWFVLRPGRHFDPSLWGNSRILERLYIDNCLPLTVELFRQLAFFILSCKPISYCRFKRIDVYIL